MKGERRMRRTDTIREKERVRERDRHTHAHRQTVRQTDRKTYNTNRHKLVNRERVQ